MQSFSMQARSLGVAAHALIVATILIAGCASGNASRQSAISTVPLASEYTETEKLSQVGPQIVCRTSFVDQSSASSPWSGYVARTDEVVAEVDRAPDAATVSAEMIERQTPPRVQSLPKSDSLYVATRMVVGRLPPLHYTHDSEPAAIGPIASEEDAEELGASTEEGEPSDLELAESDSIAELEVHRLPAVDVAASIPAANVDEPKPSQKAVGRPTRRVQITAVRPIEEAERNVQ